MKKRTLKITICFLISFLVSACRSSVQTVEGTRIVQQTVIVTQTVTPLATPYLPPSPYVTPDIAYPPVRTLHPTWTATFTETPFVKLTQKSPPLTDRQVADKIAACYQAGTGCGACEPKLNDSVQHVHPTTRMFINAPKDLYPKELFRYATTVNGRATMGYISNAGLPGEAFDGSPECWSTYVEFGGQGEVDLRIPSILEGVPDYFIRFIVG